MKPDRKSKLKLGMVTYLWGAQWDLPTLITNCEKTGFAGVELRSTHKHGVEENLLQLGVWLFFKNCEHPHDVSRIKWESFLNKLNHLHQRVGTLLN